MVETRHGNSSNSWNWKEELELLLHRNLSAASCSVREPLGAVCVSLIFCISCFKALSSFPLGNSGEEVLLPAHPPPRHLWNTRWRPVELNKWMWQSVERLQHHFQSDNQTLGPTKNRLSPWSPNGRSTCAWTYDSTTREPRRVHSQNGQQPPGAEIWGLVWFTFKKWQYQRIGHCTERLGKQRKTDFFFPVNQWCIKKTKL